MNLIEARYWLEVWFGGTLTRSYLLPYVQSYSITDRASTAFRHSLGDNPMRWHSGYRNVSISVSGLSGQGYRLGYDKQGAQRYADGPTLFGELRDFLRDYERLCVLSQETSSDGRPTAELVFRAVEEGDAWKVEDVSLVPNREAGNTRFSFSYQFQATGYAKAGPPATLMGFDAWIGSAKAYAQAATAAVDAATQSVASLQAKVQGARAALSAFLGPIRAASRLMQQTIALAGAARSLEAFPNDYAQALWQVIGDTISAFGAATSALPLGDRVQTSIRLWIFDAIAALGETERATALAIGLRIAELTRTSTSGGGATGNMLPTRNSTVQTSALVIGYVVQPGDTIAGIAISQLGDVTQAQAILALNGMIDAGTLNDGSPLRPGVVLFLPNADGAQAPVTPDGAVAQVDPYGVDLGIDSSGDLILPGVDSTDFGTMQGTANYLQAITMRCQTIQGEHRIFPSYGIPTAPGDLAVAATAGLIASQLREQLAMDPRTAGVGNIGVADNGDAYLATATVTGKLGAPVTLTVPLET